MTAAASVEQPALARVLGGTVDARPIAAVRVVIGATAVARAVVAYAILTRLLLPTTLRVPYVPWLPMPPPRAIPWLVGLWAGAALLFALGCWTRVAGSALAAAMLYVLLLDEQTYSNHLYLLVLVVVLLVLADAGAAYGVDARRRRRPLRAQAYAVFLLRTQVSATYAFAALSKLNAPYLAGATLAAYTSRDLLVALPEAARLPFVLAASWGTIVLELGLAVALWSRRWRRAAVPVGAALHVGMIALLPPGIRLQLAIFALEMLALYAAFFVPAAAPGGGGVATRTVAVEG